MSGAAGGSSAQTGGVEVRFIRRADNGSMAEFSRPDGVQVRLQSFDRTGVVPHDLAHLVVEKSMRLDTGLWGSLAAGAEFGSVELVGGRVRHDHKARSAALRKANERDLGMVELLVGAVLNEVSGRPGRLDYELTAPWSIYRPGTSGPAPGAGKAAAGELAGWARRWSYLPVHEGVTATWPVASRRS